MLRFLADRVCRDSECRDALVSVVRLSAADATVQVAAANALTVLNCSGVSRKTACGGRLGQRTPYTTTYTVSMHVNTQAQLQ